MAVAIVGSPSSSRRTTNASSTALPIPAHAVGDLVLFVLAKDGTGAFTFSDITVTNQGIGGTNAMYQGHYWRIIDGSEGWNTAGGSTTTVTHASEGGAWVVSIWRGFDPSDPFDGVTPTSGTDATAECPSNTPTDFDASAQDTVWVATAAWDGDPTLSSYPAAFTDNRVNQAGSTAGAGIAFATVTVAQAASPAATFTISAAEGWRAGMLAFREAPGPIEVFGTVAVTAAGTIAVAGTRETFGSAAVSATGTITAAGIRTVLGSASLSGAGTISVAGLRTVLGVAAVTGTLTIDITGTGTSPGPTEVFGVASVTGTGTIAAAGTRTVLGTAAVTAVGTISASGLRTVYGVSTVEGTSVITATGWRLVTGVASVTGAGTISVTGTRTVFGAVAIAGSLTITASGGVELPYAWASAVDTPSVWGAAANDYEWVAIAPAFVWAEDEEDVYTWESQ